MDRLTGGRRFPIAADTALLCVTFVIAPELFGGAFPWAIIAITSLCVASLGASLWVRRSAPTPAFDALFVVMSAAWVWTCLQCVPVPARLARLLQLRSLETAGLLDGLAWADRVPITVSHEPGATLLQIVIGVGVLAAFLAARLGGSKGLRPLAIATVISAVAIGTVGFAHEAAHSDALFGLYSPRFTTSRMLAPLMNSNHLAGFSLLGSVIAAGLAADGVGRGSRIAWIAASVFCASVVAWTLSRGGIGSLLFGFVLFGVWLHGRRGSRGGTAAIPVAVVGATVIGVAAFAGLEPILRRFEAPGLDKLEVAARGFRLLEGSALWLGVGRGAFSSAFVAEAGSLARYTHPENLIVQWTTEWGIVLAIALALVLVPSLWRRFRSADEPVGAAVCVGIFALGLQNMVDFSLEMAGVVVVVAALLGTLLPTKTAPSSKRSRGLLLAILGVFAIVLVTVSPGVLGSDTQSIVDRLTKALEGDDGDLFEAELRRGLALHPAEPTLALLAGSYAGSRRHPDTTRWLSIAMQLAPTWAAPHALTARWLFAEGMTDQALIEIREAERRRAGSAREVLCAVLARFPSIEHVERAAPSDGGRIGYLDRAASCRGLPLKLRKAIDEAILADDPTHVTASLREARRLQASDEPTAAVELLRRAAEAHPDDGKLWLTLIRAALDNGRFEEARTALEQASAAGLESSTLLEAEAVIQASLERTGEMRATLARLRGRARGDARRVARSFVLEGELEASLGNIDRALRAYTSADVADPNSGGLRRAAALSLAEGRYAEAGRIYATMCERSPGGPACRQRESLPEVPAAGTTDQTTP